MITIAICDDDNSILDSLEELLAQYHSNTTETYTVTRFDTSEKLQNAIQNEIHFSIYLLDILMPTVSGMELATLIREKDSTADLVFLTSSPEYAVDSYKVKAKNYILKPIDQNTLFQALDELFADYTKNEQDFLVLSGSKNIQKILLNSLLYVEVIRDKLYYHTYPDSEVIVYGKLRDIEEELLSYPQFLKIHRSYIVNMDYLKTIDAKNVILLHVATSLPLSRNLVSTVKEQYITYMTTKASGGYSI